MHGCGCYHPRCPCCGYSYGRRYFWPWEYRPYMPYFPPANLTMPAPLLGSGQQVASGIALARRAVGG